MSDYGEAKSLMIQRFDFVYGDTSGRLDLASGCEFHCLGQRIGIIANGEQDFLTDDSGRRACIERKPCAILTGRTKYALG